MFLFFSDDYYIIIQRLGQELVPSDVVATQRIMWSSSDPCLPDDTHCVYYRRHHLQHPYNRRRRRQQEIAAAKEKERINQTRSISEVCVISSSDVVPPQKKKEKNLFQRRPRIVMAVY